MSMKHCQSSERECVWRSILSRRFTDSCMIPLLHEWISRSNKRARHINSDASICAIAPKVKEVTKAEPILTRSRLILLTSDSTSFSPSLAVSWWSTWVSEPTAITVRLPGAEPEEGWWIGWVLISLLLLLLLFLSLIPASLSKTGCWDMTYG